MSAASDAEALALLARSLAQSYTPAITYAGIGDSLIAATNGSSGPVRACLQYGRQRFFENSGVGGKRSDEIIAAQLATALTFPRDGIMVMAGTNDIGQQYPSAATQEATLRANKISMWNAIRAAGKMPMDLGIMPTSDSVARSTRQADHELWVQQYCMRNRIPHAHLYSIMANINGGMITAYRGPSGGVANTDQIHPGGPGEEVMAAEIVKYLDQPYRIAPFYELIDRAAGSGIICPNAISFGGVGSALPSGWVSVGTGGAYSVVADTSGQFNWLRTTLSAASASNVGVGGTGQVFTSLGGTRPWAIGDRIAIGCVIRWSTGVTPTVQLNVGGTGGAATTKIGSLYLEPGGTSNPYQEFVYQEYTIDGGTNCNFLFQAQATQAGYFDVSRPIVYNLTANGLA